MTGYASMLDALEAQAQRYPDKAAVVFASGDPAQDATLTFSGLVAQSSTLAGRLAEDARPGERVLLLFSSGLEFVVGYFASLMAGLIAVPMMPPRRTANRDSSRAIIADCAPVLALSAGGQAADVPEATLVRLAEGNVHHVPVILSDAPSPDPVRRYVGSRDGIAHLQYTSGSTSVPKGVLVSHRNLVDNLDLIRDVYGNHAGSTHVGWIPMYHDLGLVMNLLQPLYIGATSVIMQPSAFLYRPLDWLRTISRFGAEVAAAPNFAYQLCVDRFDPRKMDGIDLGRWAVATNGAEPVRARTLARFAETFAPYGLRASTSHPTYGLAEATLVVSAASRDHVATTMAVSASALGKRRIAAPSSDQDSQTLVGCGYPLAGHSIAIVDPDSGAACPPDSVGEVWVHGPCVADGYWNDPDDATGTFTAQVAGDPSGMRYLRTGDLGFLNDHGELFIVGRLKEVLIIRGANYYPQDIEATIADANPALRRDHGAVFCMDAPDGEKLVLVQEVERTERHGVDVAALSAQIRAAVVNNHGLNLDVITIIRPGSLPKTTSGKIQRIRARELYQQGLLEVIG